MPYIIDGHNLIPNVPGLDLNKIDDEIQLKLLHIKVVDWPKSLFIIF